MSEKEQNEKPREYAIDILRIFAAIWILLFHYTFRGYAQGDYSILYFPYLGPIFKYGFWGVPIFFMISGYTILSSAKNKDFQDFLISRLSRLFPAYWIAVILTTIVTFFIGGERFHVGLKQCIINLSMLQYYFGIEEVDGVYWFLAAILKFYLMVAVIVGLRLIKFQEYLAGLWLVAVIAILCFFEIEGSIYSLVLNWASFLIAGIIFLSIKNKGWNFYRSLVLIIALSLSLYQGYEICYILSGIYNTQFSPFVVLSIIILIYLAIYISITINWRPKNPKRLLLFGAATYPLFLIHHNIGFMTFNALGRSINKYFLLCVTSILIIFVAIVISKYLEPIIYSKLRMLINRSIDFIKIRFRKTEIA